MKTIKLQFINKEQNITLFKALNNNLGLNFVQIKTLIRKKDIKVNNKHILEDVMLNLNDEVICYVPFNVDIVYEDENILLVNKPKHIETVSTTSLNSLEYMLSQIYPYCVACNRLDTNTTGINVFALNKESEEEILNAFKQNRVIKKYLAVVSGRVQNNAILRDFLVKNTNNSTVKVFKNKVENSVEIITEYKLIKNLTEDLSLIEVTLHTGRTHQIRAHLSFYDIFILGDEKYGKKEINKKYKKHTQSLISYCIAFDFLDNSKLKYISNRQFVLNVNTKEFNF